MKKCNFYLLFVLITFINSLAFAAQTEQKTPPYNIILIINDQQSYDIPKAKDYQLPARQTLAAHGVTFENHYTASAMCSPSRAAFLTGAPPQVNGVFDQEGYYYVHSLDPNRPNMGSVLKSLGYQTAYFGKFEMDKTLLKASNTTNYSTLAQPYGFDVFNTINDTSGASQQGYVNDSFYIGEAVSWLRQNNADTNTNKKPFFLVVSLLNPHDIMYGDANIPGTPQSQHGILQDIYPPPHDAIYAKDWQFALPASLDESLTAKGMPNALTEYQIGWDGARGYIPTSRKDMWHYYDNYYLNALRDNDRNLQVLINALTALNLWQNTVIILSADHGEMAGAHGGIRGKGPFVYEQNAHLPLIIAHPQGAHQAKCKALTSHIDLLPTIVNLTGLPPAICNQATKNLVGHDFSSLLFHPEQANLHAIRPAILFNYVGLSTIDGNFLLDILQHGKTRLRPPLTKINLDKRGFLAFVYDGRYKFARYYAPANFNTPKTLDEIFNNNDVQLFDLAVDPNEQHNLALDREKNAALILRMNALLNELIAKEVGVNDGRFLPEIVLPKH